MAQEIPDFPAKNFTPKMVNLYQDLTLMYHDLNHSTKSIGGFMKHLLFTTNSFHHLIWIVILLSLSFFIHCQTSLEMISKLNIPLGSYLARNIKGGGDINGDGSPDVIVSYYNPIINDNNEIYIYHSIPDSNSVPAQILTTTNPNFSGFGNSISYNGDLNSDGFDDVVISVSGYNWDDSGAVAIFWGGNTLSITPDVLLEGSVYTSGMILSLNFGSDIITNCDVNGDGYDDLLIYARGPQMYYYGHIYCFYGGPDFDTQCDFHIQGDSEREYLGFSLATGDLNNDGCDELICYRITDYDSLFINYNINLSVYQIGNQVTPILTYNTVLGNNQDIQFSRIVANGDLNGDDYNDLILTPFYFSNSVYLYYGCSVLSQMTLNQFFLSETNPVGFSSYCDTDSNIYSDIFGMAYCPDSTYTRQFRIYTQANIYPDFTPDYYYNNESQNDRLSVLYYLNDSNNDGYKEFVCYSDNDISTGLQNYVKFITEHYVSNEDETTIVENTTLECYPNPFSDNITFASTINNLSDKIVIYNIKGQLINELYLNKNGKTFWAGLSYEGKKTTNGVYFCQYMDENKRLLTKKIVKIKK